MLNLHTKRSLILILQALILLGMSGCKESGTGLRFSHALHATEAKCTDCHKGGSGAQEADCSGCHEIDRANPSEKCLFCHLHDDYEVKAKEGEPESDLIFGHDAHDQDDCAKCHFGVARAGYSGVEPVKMDRCMGCHDGGDAPEECSTCHEKITRDNPPLDHMAGWARAHGARADRDTSCNWCHGEDACTECHKSSRPSSHTAGWTNYLHGRRADFDRKGCAVCHRSDECSRCHSQKPSTHFGVAFTFPTGPGVGHAGLVEKRGGSRSCRVCHKSDFCSQCHIGGN